MGYVRDGERQEGDQDEYHHPDAEKTGEKDHGSIVAQLRSVYRFFHVLEWLSLFGGFLC
jgi:hypothetical protein